MRTKIQARACFVHLGFQYSKRFYSMLYEEIEGTSWAHCIGTPWQLQHFALEDKDEIIFIIFVFYSCTQIYLKGFDTCAVIKPTY